MPKTITTIDQLVPDARNANRGTPRGQGMVEGSLRKYGAGRSILADRNGQIIAGNKTLRLRHVTGFSKLFADTEYNKAWVTQSQIRIAKAYREKTQQHTDTTEGP